MKTTSESYGMRWLLAIAIIAAFAILRTLGCLPSRSGGGYRGPEVSHVSGSLHRG